MSGPLTSGDLPKFVPIHPRVARHCAMKFGDLAPENPALPKLCKMAAAGGGTCSPRGAHTAPGCPEAWSGCLPRALLPPLPPPLAPSSLSWGGWRRARQVGWLGPAPCRTSTPGGRSEYGRWGGAGRSWGCGTAGGGRPRPRVGLARARLLAWLVHLTRYSASHISTNTWSTETNGTANKSP